MAARPARALGTLSLLLVAALTSSCRGQSEATTNVQRPRRVVVLAPAAAEMLEALDLLDGVVGIGEFGPWPPAIAQLPVVGGYSQPNVERVLELDCDLLLTAASEAAGDAHRRLAAVGVTVVALDTSTFDGVFSSLDRLGTLFDRSAAAAEVAGEMRGRLETLAERAAGLPRRKVLFVVGRDPLYVAGPGSHIDRMIELAGGINLAQDSLAPYAQVSLETILERMPDVIVDTSDNRPDALRGRVPGNWRRWPFLPAVEENRVYWVEPGRLVIPGIRLAQMTALMGRMIHPERFGEPAAADLQERSTDDDAP